MRGNEIEQKSLQRSQGRDNIVHVTAIPLPHPTMLGMSTNRSGGVVESGRELPSRRVLLLVDDGSDWGDKTVERRTWPNADGPSLTCSMASMMIILRSCL